MQLTKEQLALFNKRDHQVFDLVFRHYYGHIYLYVCNKINDTTEAEDITMQVFIDLYNSPETFESAENIRAYLFRLTINRCLNFLKSKQRHRNRTRHLKDQDHDNCNNDTQIRDDIKAMVALTEIVNQLPGKYGQVDRLPDCEPSIYQESADRQQSVLNMANGEATPEGNRHIKESASESAENCGWVEQLRDGEWIQKQFIKYKNVDIDQHHKTFLAMIAAEQARKVKVLQMVSIAKIAAIFIFALTATWFYFVSSGKKSNSKSAVINSTSHQRMLSKASIDSFSNSGLYMQVSTDAAANGPLYQKLPIPHGGYIKLDLPDGSRVWLSSMTTFIYPRTFSGNKRKVEVTGEAYFEVDSNTAMPFEAIVNGVHIETVGGCFNVKAHEQESVKKVTVLQGNVIVTAGPYDVLIHANQSALVGQQKRIAILLNEDTAKVVAWKDRQFLFIDDSLVVVARELARRYNLVIKGNINSDAMINYMGSRLEEPEAVLTKMRQLNRNFLYKLKDRVLTIE